MLTEVTLTPAQECIKDEQYAVLRRIYQVFQSPEKQDEVLAALNAEYDALAEQLETSIGKGAPCWHTDQALWGEYSDFYKERNGFRPRGYVTRAEVKEWIATMDVYDSATDSYRPR